MDKTPEQELLQLKFGLAFSKILEANKRIAQKNKKKGIDSKNINDSYGKISSSTGLRPASISEIISGKSNLKVSTMDALLSALGKSYSEFGKILDKITDGEISTYRKKLLEK